MGSLENLTVLITGASSGIGAALAREFVAQGAQVVLLARREDRLRDLARELGESHALAVRADVTDRASLDAAVAAALKKFGHLDVVVANAGFGVSGRVDELTVEDYRRQFETNVFGMLNTIYASLPELKKTRGRLALLGSVVGYFSAPGKSPYTMSKFAVRALADSLHAELKSDGVAVTLISPGFVASEIRNVDNQGKHEATGSDPVSKHFVMPAAKAAKHIVRGVAARRRECVVTWHGKAGVFFSKHFPGVLRFVTRGDGRE